MFKPLDTDQTIDKLAQSAIDNAKELLDEAKPNQKLYDKASRCNCSDGHID